MLELLKLFIPSRKERLLLLLNNKLIETHLHSIEIKQDIDGKQLNIVDEEKKDKLKGRVLRWRI